MSKQANAQAKALSKFNVAAWREALMAAVSTAESSGVALTSVVRQAVGMVDEEKAREVFQDAYASYYATAHGVTDEEARKVKSFRNRVSDCMAVFKADAKEVEGLVGSVQTIAAKVRAAKKGTGTPRQPKGETTKSSELKNVVDAGQVKPWALLNLALDALAKECGEDVAALEALGALKDTATELGELLGFVEPDVVDVDEAA